MLRARAAPAIEERGAALALAWVPMPSASPAARPLQVLVVGQTPRPLHGQALMLEKLLRGHFTKLGRSPVRMSFSAEVAQVGRFRARKLVHLAGVVAGIVRARVRARDPVLYYPPAGPNRVAMYRDLLVLIPTRWLFR